MYTSRPVGMVAKLAAVVVAVALTAGALLAVRQQRIMAAHDLIRSHARLVESERTLWRLRVQIGEHLSPDRVEQMATGLGPLRPIAPGFGTTSMDEMLDGLAIAEQSIRAERGVSP